MAAPRSILLDKATTARYAQLTYTSYDDGSGRGGWQVKQETGGLDAVEQQSLTARILTRFDLLPVMPDFPTPEQTAARPARLSYAPLPAAGAGHAAYWHTVDAGRDASGRPGNVFAHVVLDRDVAAPSPVRPVELWRSPGWLRPYGVPDVAAAQLTSAYPPPANPAMSMAASVEFLLAHHVDRQSVFRVMLDAVAAALAGGPALALLVDDHDEAAAWIAAISHFMSPAAAQRFAFSTHDAPEAALAGVEAGLQVIVVPRSRIPEKWELPGAVIVDAAEQPNLGDLTSGIAHRVARGAIPVTPWSALAEGVLADDEIATAVLARQDEIARELGDTGTSPAWSLAIAVTRHPDLAEFAAEAQRVIADGGSSIVGDVAWAKELVAQAQARFPMTVGQVLARLVSAAERGEDTSGVAHRLLHAVLAEPDWLSSTAVSGVPVVSSLALSADDVQRLVALSATLRADAAIDTGQAVVAALRLAELLDRLVFDSYTRVRAELLATVNAGGVEFLWTTPQWVESGGLNALATQVRATFIRPFVAQESPTRVATLRPQVVKWLYDVEVAGGVRFELPANPTEADSFLFPLAVRTVLSAREYAIPVPMRQDYVLDAVKLAVDDPHFDDASCRDLVSDLVALQVPDASELIALSTEYPRRVSPLVLATVVYRGPRDDTVMRKVVDSDDADPALVAAATLRGWHGSGLLPPREEWAHDVETLAAGDDHSWLGDAAPDLVAMLAAGSVVAAQDDRSAATGFTGALAARLPALTSSIAELIRGALRGGQLDTNWVAAQSFLRQLRLSATTTPLDDPAFGGWRWDEALLREAIAAGTYRGPRSAVELRDCTWPTVAAASADTAERFFAGYRDAAHAWLAGLGLAADHEGWGNRLWNRDEP
ncbi:hypothetical protein HH308_02900 [Gordonia sp. TBRC 11910]|uniref:Uncharacterized protein n=1 Tax=Gordonia asplenii TaxID=2725283 RepID=A0A848KPC3_9ACTN|nr:hypothetical protein [Gordonia asplenii]NMO00160.1 hypothetical protein [Gordonia asplenii]